MLDNGLYRVYRTHYNFHQANGEQNERQLAARFLLVGGEFRKLEDHLGTLSHLPSGDLTQDHERSLSRLALSGYYDLVNEDDVATGERPDEIPHMNIGITLPEASFWLMGASFSKPVRMDVYGETVYLDNSEIDPEQATDLEQRIQNGELQLRPIGEATLDKSENGQAFQDTHEAFLKTVKGLHEQGVISPDHYNSLVQPAIEQHRRYFQDSRVPTLGNVEAMELFRKTHANHGFHVSIDGNDFGLINKHLGHDEGNAAIQRYGQIMTEAASKHQNWKGFRKGGDEFHFWFEKPDHAAQFTRDVREAMETAPRVGGIFTHAVGMGLGRNHDEAERALEASKWQMGPAEESGKRRNSHQFGNAPTTIHNAMTGEFYRTPDHIAQMNAPHADYIKSKSSAYKERQDVAPPPMTEPKHE